MTAGSSEPVASTFNERNQHVLKLIPGTKDFLADERGNIYSPDGSKRTTYANGDGYTTASVKTDKGVWVTFGVHRLTALAFLNDSMTESRVFVNHRDGDVKNNNVANLEWVTAYENNIHVVVMNNKCVYPSVIGLFNDVPKEQYFNASVAGSAHDLTALQVWDSIKDGLCYNGWRFIFNSQKSLVLTEFKNQYLVKRDHGGRFIQQQVKMMDVNNGNIIIFPSVTEAAEHFNTTTSHIALSLEKIGIVKLFRKQYRVVYGDNDFQEVSKEAIDVARGRGRKEVIACNLSLKKLFVYGSASDFMRDNQLSKKAVSTILKKDSFRELNGWVFCYAVSKNIQRLKNLISVPAFV